MKVRESTWKMLREGFGCDIQLETRAASVAKDIPNFTSEWGEKHLGSSNPDKFEQNRPAAAIQDEDLPGHIIRMEMELWRKKETWSILLAKSNINNRRQISECGYHKIATAGAASKRVDVHLKIGTKGKIENEEVLVHLEALQKWGAEGFNEIDCETFIQTTAKTPWKESESKQMRSNLITKAMGWMNSPTADRGVKTKTQVEYMINNHVDRKSAERIVKGTTEKMFEEYARHDNQKRDYCKRELDRAARKEQWKRKNQLLKEKEKERKKKEEARETKAKEKQQAIEKKRLQKQQKREDREQTKLAETKRKRDKNNERNIYKIHALEKSSIMLQNAFNKLIIKSKHTKITDESEQSEQQENKTEQKEEQGNKEVDKTLEVEQQIKKNTSEKHKEKQISKQKIITTTHEKHKPEDNNYLHKKEG